MTEIRFAGKTMRAYKAEIRRLVDETILDAQTEELTAAEIEDNQRFLHGRQQ